MGCLETSGETWQLVTRGRWAALWAFWHMVLPISTDLIGAHPTTQAHLVLWTSDIGSKEINYYHSSMYTLWYSSKTANIAFGHSNVIMS